MAPEDKKVRRFFRSRGKISDAGGHRAHLSALAYITDSYFIGTVSRVHDIPRFSSPAELEKLLKALKNPSDLDDEDIARALKELKEEETVELRRRLEGALSKATSQDPKEHKEVGMMVSLDHSIYFHNPWAFRADEWMFSEMESPWAGEGRGLVLQKFWSKDGILIATCTQEVWLSYVFEVPTWFESVLMLERIRVSYGSSRMNRHDPRSEKCDTYIIYPSCIL